MTLNHLPRRAGDRSTARSRLLASSALLGSVAAACLFAPPTASAQCAPDPVSDGDDVVCTGTDTDGIDAIGANTTLTVEAGAAISTTGRFAVRMNGGHYDFINRGTISGQSLDISSALVGLYGLGNEDQSTAINEGLIHSTDGFAYALELTQGLSRFENREGATIRANGNAVNLWAGFGGTLENSGLITSDSRKAIYIQAFSATQPTEIINTATGRITSPLDLAIDQFEGDPLHITNGGVIRGAFGARIRDGSVTNLDGGVIEGSTGYALYSSTTLPGEVVDITNHGVIRGNGIAITGNDYRLINTGTIEGAVTQNFSTIQDILNTGTIIGDVSLAGSPDGFENTGHLAGNLDLGDGADVFRDFGGTVEGLITLGAGDDFVLLRPGATSTIVPLGFGPGIDSIGYSVEGTETVSHLNMMGFRGFAVEARYDDSLATIAAGSHDGPLSLFGAGTINNLADYANFAGDAVRLYSDGNHGSTIIRTPFGKGVTFINEGNLTATGGLAIRSMEDGLMGDGAEVVINRGSIYGDVTLGTGHDRLENELLIVGNVSMGGFKFTTDNDHLHNRGEIQGSVTTGYGDDRVINGGRILGLIDLGAGDDDYMIDLDATIDVIGGPVIGGDGFDAFGYSTSGAASVTFQETAGFELGAARANTVDAVLEINSGGAAGRPPGLRVSGPGTVINREDFQGFATTAPGTPAAVEVGSLARFENHGALGGAKAILADGVNSTVINHADLSRGQIFNDNSGNTGFIHDYGLGTTLINNGNIDVNAFFTAGVFIGRSTGLAFALNGEVPTNLRASFINNGRIASNYFGVRVNALFGADIVNNGEIDDIVAERYASGVTITNAATGVLGAISINGTSFPSASDGSISVFNDGRIEVASGAAINFRDDNAVNRPLAVFDDHVTNSGTIIGDILFNSGDDTFTIVGDGEVNGQVDGGADTDTLNFQDLAGDLDASSFANFLNFETLGISTTSTARIASVSGDLSAFERLVIRSGRINLATDINIDTQVAAPGILGGAGVISGDVSLEGRLAPSAGNALRIGGDLLFADTSGLDLQVSGNGASQLIVDGAATLSGARVLYAVSGLPQLDLDLGASLQFNGARTGTFSSLDFFGDPASRTTIGANAGFNGLFDSLHIQQGIVLVESDLIGNVHVGAAGVLGGNGAIFGDVTAQGLISPGASVGALTINGNLNMSPQSMLAIETGATGTDLLTVTGNAQLGGQLLFAGDPTGVTRQRSFRFLDVGGSVSGSFDTLTVGAAFSGLTNVSIGPDGLVSLVLTPQIAIDPSGPASSQAAATYFNDLITSGQATAASDAIILATNMLAGSPAALDSAMASLQPEIYASSIYAGGRQALAISDTLRPRLTRAAMRRSGFSAWLSASDGSSETDGDAARGLSGFSTDTFSTIGGIEYGGQSFLIGGFAGAINTDQSLDNAAGSTSADGAALGAYAAADLGLAQSSLSVGYIDSDASSRRTVSFLGESLTADHDLTVLTAQADIQSSMDFGSATFTPLFGATFAHVERGAASEFGGNAALDIEEVAEDLLYLDAGATISQSFDLDSGMSLTPSLWAGWRYELLAPSVSARGGLTGTATNGLYSRAAQPDRSRITLRAALAAEFTSMVSGSISYEAEFADNADAGVVSAGLSLRF